MTLADLKARLSELGFQSVLAGFALLEDQIKSSDSDKLKWAEECARLNAERDKILEDHAAEMTRVRGVFEERLKQSMAREAALRGDFHALSVHCEQIAGELSRLDAHPEVRAAKRAKIEKQRAELDAQLAALAEPEPHPAEPTTEESSTEPEATPKGE